MRLPAAVVALGLIASLAACARPGDTPSGTPSARSEVTLMASLAPGPPQLAVPPVQRMSTMGCDGRIKPVQPKPAGSVPPRPMTSAQADAVERARRALEAANPPLPRRGALPTEAAARAEACARRLSPQLTLLMHSAEQPDE